MNVCQRKTGLSYIKIGLLCLFALIFINPQTIASSLRQISIEQGLLGTTVWGIQTDRVGYVWVGSSAGLFRYDGYGVKGFPLNHPLYNAYINSLIKHEDGSLWVATVERGIWKIYPETQTAEQIIPYQYSEELSSISPNIIQWIDENTLLLGLEEQVLSYDMSEGSLDLIFSLPDIEVSGHLIRAFKALGEHLLIGSSAGLYALNRNTQESFRVFHTLSDSYFDRDNVKALHVHSNQLWVITVSGVYSYPIDFLKDHETQKDYTNEAELIFPDINIWQIKKTGDKTYLATTEGLFTYDEKTKLQRELKLSDSPYAISSEALTRVHFGENGMIWLGSYSDGLFVWNSSSKGFYNLSTEDGLLDNNVWAIAEDPVESKVWIGTEQGLNLLNLETNQINSYLEEQRNDALDNLIEDVIPHPNGKVYVLTSKGVRVFNPETGSLTVPDFGTEPVSSDVYSWGAFLAEDNSIWWFTESGLYQYKPDDSQISRQDWFADYSKIAWECEVFSDIAEGLFISCPDALFYHDYVSNENQLVTDFKQIAPETGNYALGANDMAASEDGMWWFTMGSQGIAVFNPEDNSVVKHFVPGKELPTSEFYAITKDDLGNVFWVASGQGLIRIDAKSYSVSQYTIHDGTFTNDFLYAESETLSDGRLVYGGRKGLVFIDGAKFLTTNSDEIRVFLSASHSLSKNANQSESIFSLQKRFDHNEAGLHFEFTTLDFEPTRNTLYKYDLNGPEAITYPPIKNNNITFPKLSPGNYLLTTTATNVLTGVSSEPLTTTFKVDYVWWQSPLAKIVFFLAASTIAFVWYYSRRKQQIALRKAHESTIKSEKKLSLALQSSDSRVWEWHAETNKLDQTRINDVLGFSGQPNEVSLETHIELVHPDDRQLFLRAWRRFVALKDSQFKLTYRMRNVKNEWLWFSDIAAGQLDNGQMVRANGTYTNITNQHAQEHNAALYGEVFKQAHDAVLILTQDWKVETGNNAFLNRFGLSLELIAGLEVEALFALLGQRVNHTVIKQKIKKNGHHRSETTLVFDQQLTPMLVSYSEVKGLNDQQQYLLTFISIKAIKEAEQALLKLAKYDQLTGLPNRAHLMEELTKTCQKKSGTTALMFIDLDRFKQVNDSLGHNRGDELLQKVSSRLSQVISKRDLLARFGGDEFIVLVNTTQLSQDDLKQLAEKIILAIAKPVDLGVANVAVSPSIGIAQFPEDAANAPDLLQAADVAMYHAKSKGRSAYEFFSKAMKAEAQDKLKLEYLIKQDHNKGLFVNYYQPIYKVDTNTLQGFEVLLRWNRSEKILSPDFFLKEAEDIGLLASMTVKALDQALIDLNRWHEKNPKLHININISAKHFEQSNFIQEFSQCLNTNQTEAEQVHVELTESTLLQNRKEAMKTIAELRSRGHKIFLDDFGTGYSSLAYIHELSLDGVKIDKSFVFGLGKDKKTTAITKGIIKLCADLGFETVAEGVETEAQAAFLSDLGTTVHQGFLYAKPLSASEVDQLIEK